jgi:hypothetical protein
LSRGRGCDHGVGGAFVPWQSTFDGNWNFHILHTAPSENIGDLRRETIGVQLRPETTTFHFDDLFLSYLYLMYLIAHLVSREMCADAVDVYAHRYRFYEGDMLESKERKVKAGIYTFTKSLNFR